MNNPTGLIAISGCDNVNRIGDVIFVHGLGGDARGTWHPQGKRNDDNFWPTWLGEELPDVGIWSLGYEVEPFKWKGNTMPLVDRATNTLAVLDSHAIGYRPLVFITHSLGGLLVKQMLRCAWDCGNPEWKVIVEQTKGIVFLSTPHSGSNIANWVKYIGVILQASVSVDELDAHHSRLRELNEVYRNHEGLCEIPIQVYCEKETTYGFLVVDETSANPGIKGVTPIPMDDNHLSICTPSSRDNLLYRRVMGFIKKEMFSSHPIRLELKERSVEESKNRNPSMGNETIAIAGNNGNAGAASNFQAQNSTMFLIPSLWLAKNPGVVFLIFLLGISVVAWIGHSTFGIIIDSIHKNIEIPTSTSPERNYSTVSSPTPSPNTSRFPTNSFESEKFPKKVCGDPKPTNIQDYPVSFYPIFIDNNKANLSRISADFCADARPVFRENINKTSIKVASFTSSQRAEEFRAFLASRFGNSEVGEPRIVPTP